MRGVGYTLVALFCMGCWKADDEQPSSIDQPVSFDDAFALGESAGHSKSLQNIVAAAAKLNGDARANYFDGAAHTYTAYNLNSLSETAQLIESIVPKPHRDVFHDGVAQAIVAHFNGDPIRVLPEIEVYRSLSRQPLYNGVRIGFWRLYRADVVQGLAMSQAYPVDYHASLMEEFGWLIGDHYIQSISEEWSVWKAHALPNTQCVLIHGMVRGWWMRHLAEGSLSRDEMIRQTESITTCQSMTWRGVSWATVLIFGSESTEWMSMIDSLSPTQRASALQVTKSDTFWE